MTPEEHLRYARHLAFKIWLNCKCGSEYDQELAARIIAEALHCTEQKVLEK